MCASFIAVAALVASVAAVFYLRFLFVVVVVVCCVLSFGIVCRLVFVMLYLFSVRCLWFDVFVVVSCCCSL